MGTRWDGNDGKRGVVQWEGVFSEAEGSPGGILRATVDCLKETTMTQFAYDPYAMPARQSNGLGLAGFICSLVGLVLTGGLLCPIGLILSLAAIGKQPRGFAIAGLIIGLIGTCGGVLVLLVFGAVILAALGVATVAAIAFSEPQKLEVTSDMVTIAMAVEHYRDKNNYLPATLEMLALEQDKLVDPWGQKYRYVQEDPKEKFDLVTAGEDKLWDTKDDVRLSRIDEMWKMSKGVHISGSGKDGVVKIDLGGNKIDIAGDEKGGKVKIDIGGKKIEVTGDEDGGSVDMGTKPGEGEPEEKEPEGR